MQDWWHCWCLYNCSHESSWNLCLKMAADHFAIDFTQTYVWVSVYPASVHTAIYNTTSNFPTNYTTSRLSQTGTFPSQLTFRLLCVCIWTFGVGSWIKYYPSQMSFNEAQRWTRLHCITSWPSAGFNWIHFQSVSGGIEAVILSFSCPSSSRWALSHCRAYIAASLSNKTSRCLASLSQSEAQNQYLSLDSSSPPESTWFSWCALRTGQSSSLFHTSSLSSASCRKSGENKFLVGFAAILSDQCLEKGSHFRELRCVLLVSASIFPSIRTALTAAAQFRRRLVGTCMCILSHWCL